MPEASVDEDGDSHFTENEVRRTGKPLVTTPAREPMLPQDGHHPLLSTGIALAADRGHDLGSLGRGGEFETAHLSVLNGVRPRALGAVC